MKKYILYFGAALVLIGGFLYWNSQPVYSPASTDTVTTSSSTIPVAADPAKTSFTLAEVEAHNNEASCYAAINGNVYDLTTWVAKHPGGRSKILMICGRDGSTLFNTAHGGDRKPSAKLATFLVGTLTQ
ncbi:MAG: cytochrome b5-like heme/steroid binding domain-containing protein [Candidatus Paceibacterota bacterium]